MCIMWLRNEFHNHFPTRCIYACIHIHTCTSNFKDFSTRIHPGKISILHITYVTHTTSISRIDSTKCSLRCILYRNTHTHTHMTHTTSISRIASCIWFCHIHRPSHTHRHTDTCRHIITPYTQKNSTCHHL